MKLARRRTEKPRCESPPCPPLPDDNVVACPAITSSCRLSSISSSLWRLCFLRLLSLASPPSLAPAQPYPCLSCSAIITTSPHRRSQLTATTHLAQIRDTLPPQNYPIQHRQDDENMVHGTLLQIRHCSTVCDRAGNLTPSKKKQQQQDEAAAAATSKKKKVTPAQLRAQKGITLLLRNKFRTKLT